MCDFTQTRQVAEHEARLTGRIGTDCLALHGIEGWRKIIAEVMRNDAQRQGFETGEGLVVLTEDEIGTRVMATIWVDRQTTGA